MENNIKDSSLNDMEVLQDILNGKIKIKDLDKDLKIRLISLCNNRLEEINKKINKKQEEINQINSIIKKIPKVEE